MALSDGLVGYWSPWLGSSGYTLLDRTPYKNHGTLTNMDAGTDWVGATINGRSGYALDCDGVDDRVSIADNLAIRVTGPITIAFWANITNNGGISTLISKSAGSDGEYEVFADFRSGATTLAWRPGITSNLTSFFSGYTGAWHHFTFTCDGSASGSTTSCYRNGVIAGTITTNAVRAVSNYALAIGARPSGVNLASARFADVSIHNRALTPSEIATLYRLGPGWLAPPELQPIRIRTRAIPTATPTRNRSSRYLAFPG